MSATKINGNDLTLYRMIEKTTTVIEAANNPVLLTNNRFVIKHKTTRIK